MEQIEYRVSASGLAELANQWNEVFIKTQDVGASLNSLIDKKAKLNALFGGETIGSQRWIDLSKAIGEVKDEIIRTTNVADTLGTSINSINQFESKLASLNAEFKKTEIESEEWFKIAGAIQTAKNELDRYYSVLKRQNAKPDPTSLSGLSLQRNELLTQLRSVPAEATMEWQALSVKLRDVDKSIEKLTTRYKLFTESAKLSNTVVDQNGKLAQRTRLLNNELAFTIQDGAYAFNDLRMGVLGISNNLPRVAYQMREMAMITGSWSTAIKTAALGLFSFNGVMSLAVGALVAWSALSGRGDKATKESTESIEDLTKKIDNLKASLAELSKVQEDFNVKQEESQSWFSEFAQKLSPFNVVTPKSGMKLAPEIENNQRLLKGLLDSTREGTKGILQFAKANNLSEAQLKSLNSQLESFSNTVLTYGDNFSSEADKTSRALADSLGLTRNQLESATKEINKFLNPSKPKAIEYTNLLGELYKDILDTVTKINSMQAGGSFAPRTIGTSKTVGGTKSGGISQEYLLNQIRVSQSEIREAFPIETTLVDAFQGSITDAGRVAFESIFGEANSLLEIFIQNIASSFLSLGASDIAGGLLNVLTGGAAGGASGVLGFLGLSKASSQPQQININLDGERLAVAMVKSGTYQRVSQLNSSLRRN